MNGCKDYQKMIKDYDDGRLSLKQEERFIKHIMNCDDCKEELEIYYIVSYGLDENYDAGRIPEDIRNCIDSYDFKTLVDLKLKNSIEQCRQLREWNHNMRIMYAVMNMLMIMMVVVCAIIRFL